MEREQLLRRRIRWFTGFFIIGLFLSGATAIPLRAEVDWLVEATGAELTAEQWTDVRPEWALWLVNVQRTLYETDASHPFLLYGTDWLAFGHFVVALAFVGALRDPVRNRWLFDFGLLACGLVIPYALVFGAIRGVPFWWRLIDCSFGVFGAVPLWFCRRWVKELEETRDLIGDAI